MELEFDKEIDALLRKARSEASVTTAGDHLDADAINVFAEDLVPASLRRVYTKHFADCDRCRRLLSQTALLHEPVAATAVAGAPAQAVPWPPVEKAAPWYRSLFRTPGLAVAMGLLVLTFGAGLIYLVTQRNSNDSVAMSPSAANANFSVPYSGIEANTATNTAANAASSAAVNSNASKAPSVPSNTAAAGENAPVASGTGTGYGSGSGTATGGAAAPPPAAAAQPPASTSEVSAEKPAEPPKTDTARREDKDERESGRSRALDDDRASRDAVLSKKSVGGPLRGGGPVQGNVQSNAQSFEMPVTRRVGGKTFRNSGGAWYDSTYRGQATTNVRRSSDEYKKLDSGLRSIANELGGVVVVVWKDKAYRID